MHDMVCSWEPSSGNDNLVVSNTPWEVYKIDGVPVHVKREDLCCPPPGPSFSKIRGVKAYLEEVPNDTVVGVLDTIHSKAGWGVAYVCNALGLECVDFYPVYKHEPWETVRPIQAKAKELGATLYPMKAWRSSVMYGRAKKILDKMADDRALMMPNALKLQATVDATAEEVRLYTPQEWMSGTWIVSISSGTIAAGVLKGLGGNDNVCVIAHMGYSRSSDYARKYMIDMAKGDVPSDILIIDEGYEYTDSVKESCPFECNKFYDLKAWKWLKGVVASIDQPVIFWNIGD